MYDEIIQAIIDLAENASGAKIVTGSMPPDNGIAITGQGGTDSVFLDIGTNERLNIVCNGKNTDQQTVIRQLNSIHSTLTRRKDFPHTALWQIYAITTTSSPRPLGKEQNSQWLYGSSLLVKFNVKGI